MKSLSRDTPPDVQQAIFDMLGRASVSKKLSLTFDLIQATRLLVLAGLRHRHPKADEASLRRKLVSKLLPREEVIKAYGFDPQDERD
jgi:hypothetical protein